jgi:hypothetical protein
MTLELGALGGDGTDEAGGRLRRVHRAPFLHTAADRVSYAPVRSLFIRGA